MLVFLIGFDKVRGWGFGGAYGVKRTEGSRSWCGVSMMRRDWHKK